MDNYRLSSLNGFTGYSIDRIARVRRDHEWTEERLNDPSTCLIPLWRAKNLLTKEKNPRAALIGPDRIKNLIKSANSIILLGEEDNRAYFAIDLPDDSPSIMPDLHGLGEFKDLRGVGAILDRREGSLLAYARAMTYWHYRHRFCGDCGSPTQSTECGHTRICTNGECAKQHFPRTDPAIIVIVSSGKHCLLARQAIWPKGLYSTIAGFVEPGESLEAAVCREVQEETGVRVDEVHYHSSQPWPFPGSIMLGFSAKAAGKDIFLDNDELEDARWLSREEIQKDLRTGKLLLPSQVSIAFRLVEDWFDSDGTIRLRSVINSS